MISTADAVDAIAQNPWTALVLSSDGEIADAVTFSTAPTARSLEDFATTRAKGRRFRFFEQARLEPARLEAMLRETGRPAARERFLTPLGQSVEDFQPRLQETAWARVVANALSGWIAKWMR